MKNKTLFLTTLAAALSLVAVPASAGIVTYTDLATWTQAGPVNGPLTFTGLSATNYNTPLVVTPLQFGAGFSTYLSVLNNGFGPGTGNFIATLDNVTVSPTTGFAGTVYGLGFNLKCYACGSPQNATITITDVNNAVYTFSALSTPNYFGFRSTAAVSTVNISYGGGNNNTVALDDVGYAGQDTPEAATMILIGTGLAVLTRFRKYSNIGSFA